MRELLQEVRSGNQNARNQLFRLLTQDQRVRRTVSSLSYEKSVVEREDVEAEFWRGVLQGVAVVRHDWGDPVLHLIKRGVWQVKSVVRESLNRSIVQHCCKCGLYNKNYNYERTCETCKAPVENVGRQIGIDNLDFSREYLDGFAQVTTVEYSQSISQTQRRLLELLVQYAIDCTEVSYADLGRIIGISKVRVYQQLVKLRKKVRII